MKFLHEIYNKFNHRLLSVSYKQPFFSICRHARKRSGARLLRALPATGMLSVLVLILYSCASMGRPEGGPRDMTPPVFVRATPAMEATKVNPKRILINFDENVQLEDAFNKVIVSPVQLSPPQITANGRTVTVDFRDTLQANSTYTIDFGDAIKDLNEGNILDGFAYSFSTGDSIDSLKISGTVLQAENLEPAQGMIVGIHSNLSDTALSKLPFDRVTRTNQLGQFTIRNLKPGRYNVFALNDINRDYRWDRTEDVAFLGYAVEPTVESFTLTDSLLAKNGEDSLIRREGVRFLPNDLLLTWFNEGYQANYLKDNTRPTRETLKILFNSRQDSLPKLELLNTELKGKPSKDWGIIQSTTNQDSLTVWLTNSSLISNDSLKIAMTWLKPDSTERLVQTTDTLLFSYYQAPKGKKAAKEEAADSVTQIPTFNISVGSGSTQELNLPLILNFPTPLEEIKPEGVRLEEKTDTVWHPVEGWKMTESIYNPLMSRRIDYPWKSAGNYRLIVDSLAARDIYGVSNRPLEHEFKTRGEEEYGKIIFNLHSLDGITAGTDSTAAVVELLDASDKVVAKANALNNKALLNYIKPGTYYARMYFDWDGDGKWTTGNIAEQLQPEPVYYYPKSLVLKKNWDVEQTWTFDEQAVDEQKPEKIKKNKPKKPKFSDQQEEYYDEEEEFNVDDNPFDDPRNRRRKSTRNGTNPNVNSNNFNSFTNQLRGGGRR